MESAVMAGLKVVPVKTHTDGNLDLQDLKTKAMKHQDKLAAFMVRVSPPQVFNYRIFEQC
jgi:glycine dehydrogenase